MKGAPGAAPNRQKASSGRPVEYSLTSSPAGGPSLAKGRRDSASKHSGNAYH